MGQFLPNLTQTKSYVGLFTLDYLCTRFDIAQPWVEALSETGARVKNPIFWIKDNQPLGDLAGDRGNAGEIILFAHLGRHLLRGKRVANAWSIAHASPTLHPTTKPIELVRRCILASSDPTLWGGFPRLADTGQRPCRRAILPFSTLRMPHERKNERKKYDLRRTAGHRLDPAL